MTDISVLGAGAFGTALAISLAGGRENVTLWARDVVEAASMAQTRENSKRLAGCRLPNHLRVSSDLTHACQSQTLLLASPMQKIANFAQTHSELLANKTIVCCCKGVDLESNKGPVTLLEELLPHANVAILSGPSFAIDIAQGLPTALTLSGRDPDVVNALQGRLTTENIRLYSNLDPIGVEFGGALKNVMAIACGIAIGAGLGESARAALMTRGFSEMQRLAVRLGAEPETLVGLSGFGDLVLTCTSEKSRNFSHGIKLGRGEITDPTITVEGAATSRAVAQLSKNINLDMPITRAVSDILTSSITIKEAIGVLLSRPLTKE
jgi:glycerol-3-phosphate dehydrogenase (NAD(P)+)